jgi:predicted ATP-grasp superfamily ATP-dependent carboligase
MRVHAVATGIREKLSAETGAPMLKSQLQQYSQQSIDKILIRDSKHRLRLLAGEISRYAAQD